MEYIEKSNLFFVYDAKAEVQKRICSGQFTIIDDDFATLGFKCGVDYVMDVIKEAEVKDVAPVVHAHWEYRYDTGIYQTEFLCSRCKGLIETYSCTVDEVEYEYCPHCGAKMDEEEGQR